VVAALVLLEMMLMVMASMRWMAGHPLQAQQMRQCPCCPQAVLMAIQDRMLQ